MKLYFVGFLLVFLLGLSPKAFSQCSVCAAQVQTNVKEGNTQAKGLNAAILYLMFTPYIVAGGIGLLWFKKFKKKEAIMNIKEEKINLN